MHLYGMTILRTDIERALDELISQEEGMRFQGLAVVLGKMRWPELIARERKKDFGLDAYAPGTITPERVGKGLAASITPKLKKISEDARTAKSNFPDLGKLIFVTPGKVGNADRKRWEAEIRKDYDLELHIIEREEIIVQMMMPENAALRASSLHLNIDAEPQITDLIERIRRAADAVTRTWVAKTKGAPLIELTAVQLDSDGKESAHVMSLHQIEQALTQSRRIVLEGPAGRGKTTTLIQLAQRPRASGTTFIVELPTWIYSRRGILEYISGMPAFQAENLTAANLAQVQQTEPFLFLLNGWNEIAESNSAQAKTALQELERDFPSAGIIVATRKHHLTPPLPGAIRLTLSRLNRSQRGAYLATRLGAKSFELRARIDIDPSLEGLTRTPFILSEVASLFEAGAEIPSTKIGIIEQVLRLHERRDEHQNELQSAPIFGRQSDYLKALAAKMTKHGAVALSENNARAIVSSVVRELAGSGQIEATGAPGVLGTLTAHHVLERIDYPETAYQFEHQQLQEYYAALDLRTELLASPEDDADANARLTALYVNDPAWAEPLRMIAETFSNQTGKDEDDKRNARAGRMLVKMALAVDPVFASELVQLCGARIWNELRTMMGARLRTLMTIHDGSFRQYAIAAMLATGADDFSDVIVPLLSGQNQQTRLHTYRLWPDIHVSSFGANWPELVRTWSDDARSDFVSELLHHRADDEIASFAAEDKCVEVKKAAFSGLMWSGAEDALTRVLNSMDVQTFQNVVCENFDYVPVSFRARAIAAAWNFINTNTADKPARLQAAIDLIRLGESGLDDVVKDALSALPNDFIRFPNSYYTKPSVEYLHQVDPDWLSEWITIKAAEGILHPYKSWSPFVTKVPDGLVEKYLRSIETGKLNEGRHCGAIDIVSAHADAKIAARVFAKLCEQGRKIHAEEPELEREIRRQLENLFRSLPGDLAVAGILSSITNGDPIDISVVTRLMSRVARSDMEPLHILNEGLRERIQNYLRSSIDVVLYLDDFSGEEKANLVSAIAQVGTPEDMSALLRIVYADVERIRRGRAARAIGDRGPIGNGGAMSYSTWHVSAIIQLDPVGAEQVLIALLLEPEYRSAAAAGIARDYLPERSLGRSTRYDLVWAARLGNTPASGDDQKRLRFAAALTAEIERLRETTQDGKPAAGLINLAKTLAAVDGRGSTAVVLDLIAAPDQWNQYTCLDTIDYLFVAGVILPATTVFSLVDSVIGRTDKWMQESDKFLLLRTLMLCPFVDDPAAGIEKVREVLDKRQFSSHELRDLVTALGESQSDAAVDLLYELALNAKTFEQCEDCFINAFAKLNSPHARELLMGFVDTDIRGLPMTRRTYREDIPIARLTELAQRHPEAATRLRELCNLDLPELNRHVLSKVMASIGTADALDANLNLIDDAKSPQVPQGIWEQLESLFVEKRPYGSSPNFFTEHARASNEPRARLFKMSLEDTKRRKSTLSLLGQIEEWRLEYGRPTDESRHPDLNSGLDWPPTDS